MLTKQELIDLILASFEAERQGDVDANNRILHDEFAVTDMVTSKDESLPRISGEKLHKLIGEAFKIKGREYIFKTVIADEESQTVVVEFIESYPDPSTGKVYRTPQVAICSFKDAKLYRTRHYMDPRLSHEGLSEDAIEKAFE